MKRAFLIGKIMVILFIIIGIGLFGLGVKRTIELNAQTEGYEETTGYYVYKELYSEAEYEYSGIKGGHKENATYALVYEYYVGNEIYTVKTDYGTEAIPDRGYEKTIYYNPYNPAEAVVSGPGGAALLMFMGAMFVLVPGVMIVGYLAINGAFGMNANRIMDLVIGIVFTGFSVGMLYMMAGTFNPAVIWMMAGPWALIPVLMTICGLIVLFRGILGSKR